MISPVEDQRPRFTQAGVDPVRLMAEKGWKRHFEDPIPLPDGCVLVTLRDAATYITALSKKEACEYRESKSERIDDEVRPR